MCPETGQIEDMVQDTYEALLRSFGDFRCEAALSTWIYTIARTRRCRKTRRLSYPTSVPLDENCRNHPAPARLQPDSRLAGDEIGAAIDDALGFLGPIDRTLMIRFYLDQQSIREAASALGLSETAAKSRLHRARLAVRRRLRSLRSELAADAAAHRIS
jgi:RNA polymerase sigma-70 factor (ECF subfamily)